MSNFSKTQGLRRPHCPSSTAPGPTPGTVAVLACSVSRSGAEDAALWARRDAWSPAAVPQGQAAAEQGPCIFTK